jgi:predicted nucleotidyltransferase
MKIDANKLRGLVKSRGLTNTKLAAQAGITRQALQGILKDGGVVEVRDKTVKGLAHALRLPDESLLSADPLMGYRQAVADEHAYLAFQGLSLPTTEPRSMDEVFVPVRLVRLPDREQGHDCQPAAAESELEPTEESDELTVAHCLTLHHHILIRGEPGSGKTTALRHAARAYARGPVSEDHYPKQSRVPLLVRLADFAKARERDNDVSLVRYVVTRTLRDAAADYWAEVEQHIGRELERGGCLVLLDGLDEVGGDSSLSIVLRRFIEGFGRNQFVLSSRVVGLDAGPWRKLGFAAFQVAPWRDEDIRDFTRRWYGALPLVAKRQKKEHEERAEELTKAILSHPPLRAIASNPLMLTILAALHYNRATLPRRRVDLYAKVVEVMLETWEASKRGARSGDPLHGIVLEAREFGWLLERLALGMQREGRVLRPRWWLSDFVQQFLREQLALEGEQAKEQAERVIRYLCERAGLLVERGDSTFGFWHRTFLEYFAARGLLLEAEGGRDIIRLLHPCLFHPHWEEVVVHVAALLAAPRATALLRAILDDPEPAGRFLRRGQRLALRCLADGAAVADRALLEQIFSDGEAVGRSKWLGIAGGFISLLKQLRGNRHEIDAERMLREIEDGARQKLPPVAYIALYCWSHGLPARPRNGAPGTIYKKRLGGRQVELIWPAWEKRVEDPEAWYAEVFQSLRDPKTEVRCRIALVSFLSEEADSNDEVRAVLEELLVRDREPDVRAECAGALEGAVPASPHVASLLLRRLQKDKSEIVRERCAEALRLVAANDAEVLAHLKTLFGSAPERVRAGAACGLSHLDFASPDGKPVLEQFLATVASPAEPSRVRSACLWAVSSLIGKEGMEAVDRMVEKCLDSPEPDVQKTALHVLADAIAEGRMAWSQPLVERIEAMLMAVPNPCPHLFSDLAVLVGLKEIQGSRRLDRVLGDALAPVAERITMAFVFGSVARDEQVRDSDIDLMVIGDVRLKELAPALHSAEQTLGRPVNPVLFSPEKFREQYRAGNPFLLDVVRKAKIFLKGSDDELTELVADRSPD